MRNWKTTIGGVLIGIYPFIDAVLTAYKAGELTDKTGPQLILSLGVIVLGLLSKDYNTTGPKPKA